MSAPERAFKAAIVRSFRKHFPLGWHAAMASSIYGKIGMPDLRFAAEGGSVWIEAKVHPYTTSKMQRLQIARMRRAGERVAVVTLTPGARRGDLVVIDMALAPDTPPSSYTGRTPGTILDAAWWREILGCPAQTPRGSHG